MSDPMKKMLLAAALAGLGYYGYTCYCGQGQPCPNGPKPLLPTPDSKPAPRPKPRPRPGPWGPNPCPPAGQEAARVAAEGSRPQEGGRVSPDGTEEIQVDLPESERKRNVGGRDGAGLCVFTSIEYAGRWQHERELWTLQEHMRQERGGGYPEKVDAMMKKYAPNAAYAQSTGKDPAILKAILASGRMACVTYNGHDCHYSGSIAHMVSLVHYSEKWTCVSDNNFTKDNQFVWMSPDEFLRRWSGWVVWLMAPPPPPVPHNSQAGPCSCYGKDRCGCFSCRCRDGHKCPDPRCTCGPQGGIGGPLYEWRQVPTNRDQLALFLAGVQQGNYSYTWKVYRPLTPEGAWGDPCDPPALPPGVEPPTGVDSGRVPAGPSYSIRGHTVTREQALVAIQGGEVPADEHLPYVTVIGPQAQTDPVLAQLASYKGRIKVAAYDPSEWQVQVGLAYGGDVTIYLQSPSGAVLSRQDHYRPADLDAALAKGLRQADPNYDPKKDPDLGKPFQLPFDPAKVPTPVWVGGVLGGLYLLTRKGQK